MSSRFDRVFAKLAVLGVIALALTLAACGVKGPLEAPPAATPTQAQVAGTTNPPPSSDEEAQPQPRRKRIFLDWLLD